MIEIERSFLTWNDWKKLFKTLSNGGAISIGKHLVTLEKTQSNSGFIVSLFVTGKERDEKVFFKGMTSDYSPKKQEPRYSFEKKDIKEHKVKKKEESLLDI